MEVGATYVAILAGDWNNTSIWEESSPSYAYPAGPPGANDIAEIGATGTFTGDGSAQYLMVIAVTATFTGTITATRIDLPDVTAATAAYPNGITVTVSGGKFSASNELLVGAGTTLVASGNARLAGPSGAGAVGFMDFGAVVVNGGTITSETLDVFGTLDLANGVATIGTFEVGAFNGAAGNLQIASTSTISDTFGIVGLQNTGVSSGTISGGRWDNLQLSIGSAGTVDVTVNNGGIVTAQGGATIYPGQQALTIGGAAGSQATLAVDGGGAVVVVTGGIGVGLKGSGSVALTAAGKIAASGSLEAGGFTGGVANFDINGGILSVGANARLGDVAPGSLTLTGGGTFSVAGTLDEGVQTGGSGSLLISDARDNFSVGGDWIIGDAGTHSDTINAGVSFDVVGALSLGVQTGAAGTLDLNALSLTIMVSHDITVGGAGTGSLSMDGGASLQSFGGALSVGASAGGKGTVSLAGNGTKLLVGKGMTIGGAGAGTLTTAQGTTLDDSAGALALGVAAGGSGVLTLATGVTLAAGANATIGDAGSGSIDLAGSTKLNVTSGTVTLGAQAGGSGTLSLSGTNALVNTQALVVGGAGAATVTLADQTEISTTGNVTVGGDKGDKNSGGTLTLTTGSNLSDGGNLTVGDAGTGVLAINGGSLSLFGPAFTVGNAITGNGDVSIQNSSLSVTGTVTMGNSGQATFSVNSHGGLNATSIVIGNGTGSNGGFVVDGAGSSAQSGDITIGAAGVGGLQVSNKAALGTTGSATIASKGGPSQQAVVIDTKASWQIGGLLEVGLAGSADLMVQGAGQVAAGQVAVADQSGADGTIAVAGTVGGIASALSFGTSLVIGGSGTGTLQVTGGANVGPGLAGTGTIAIGALSGGHGVVSLTDAGSRLSAAVLAVGGTVAAAGGAGNLGIGAGATVSVASAIVWNTGSVTMSGGALLTDPITLLGHMSGFGSLTGALTNDGALTASGGTLAIAGAIDGTGDLTITPGADLFLQKGASVAQTIHFTGGTLTLADVADTTASISGFGAGEEIDLTAVAADGGSFAGGMLTLTETGAVVGTLTLSGIYTAANFHIVNTGGGGTAITFSSPACFTAGTRIATARGEVAVEALRAGDLLTTLVEAASAPVVWLGHRRVDCRHHSRPEQVWPVRIGAGAFGAGLPRHDLFVSPDHALYVDEVLIPAKYLINGTTIAQVPMDTVTYYHVELPRHDVILAEGLPAESYLDVDDRSSFDNGGTVVRMHPDFATRVWEAQGCAELIVTGPVLDGVRVRLAMIAAAQTEATECRGRVSTTRDRKLPTSVKKRKRQ